MPNKNYVAGRAFEYRVKKYLEKLGFYVIRAYASKGLFDLIAVPPIYAYYTKTFLIQCKKNDYLKPSERQSIREAKDKYSAHCCIATRDEKGHIILKSITDYPE